MTPTTAISDNTLHVVINSAALWWAFPMSALRMSDQHPPSRSAAKVGRWTRD